MRPSYHNNLKYITLLTNTCTCTCSSADLIMYTLMCTLKLYKTIQNDSHFGNVCLESKRTIERNMTKNLKQQL